MNLLVAYASRHGATRGIAEWIADRLRRDGLDVTLAPVQEIRDPGGFEAFVIGSSAYFFHWEKAATEFVRRHRDVLAARPVWLFSSGPLGTDQVDADGNDVREGATPREFVGLVDLVHPRAVRVFFGAYDPDSSPSTLMERLTRLMPAARDALPVGDFRDREAVEAWAEEIAAALLPAAAGRGRPIGLGEPFL